MRVEQSRQVRQLQNFSEMFGHIAKFQLTVRLPHAGQAADDRAQAAAIDKRDLAQVQDDGAPVTQQPGNVLAKGVALAAGDNSPVAADDGDASNFTSAER
jgi:hypothetical protein